MSVKVLIMKHSCQQDLHTVKFTLRNMPEREFTLECTAKFHYHGQISDSSYPRSDKARVILQNLQQAIADQAVVFLRW